jgi:hypothetical protein
MKGSASALTKHNTSKSPSGGLNHSDKLEVTIIPVDEEPYSKMINIPSSMMGKCFSEDIDKPIILYFILTLLFLPFINVISL